MSWFRLARMLSMSVSRAQDEISSAEYVEWAAFLSLEYECARPRAMSDAQLTAQADILVRAGVLREIRS